MAATYLQTVWQKTVAARHGDAAALQWLRDTNDELVSQANRRLDTLERHGYTNYAYKYAQNYTDTTFGSDRFILSSEHALTPRQLHRQIGAAYHFNQLKTSRAKGYKESEEKRLDTFIRRGYFGIRRDENGVPYGYLEGSRRKARNFFRLLGELGLDGLVDWGESEALVTMMREAFTRGYSARRIRELWDTYRSSNMNKKDFQKLLNSLAGRRGRTYEEVVIERDALIGTGTRELAGRTREDILSAFIRGNGNRF